LEEPVEKQNVQHFLFSFKHFFVSNKIFS